uniref:CHHC U11-48K-type domain-containing protein n=1 Tax=Parascaris univalens TaxID=6257 RepID=A0A915BHU4_PARUN
MRGNSSVECLREELIRLVVCPYSEEHKIPSVDIFLHLAKCRKDYHRTHGSCSQLKKCKYNGCHFLPLPEIELHEKLCHSAELYRECEEKMKYPPIALREYKTEQKRTEDMIDAIPHLVDL